MSSKSCVFFFAAITAASLAATSIDTSYGPEAIGELADMPVVIRVLGEARNIASNIAFLNADIYYHRGLAHPEEQNVSCLRERTERGASRSDNVRDPDITSLPERLGFDPLLRISKGIEIDVHAHAGSDDLQEIVPWLYYANKIDPNNIQVYTITAFYLANRFGEIDEAISLLRKGLVNNPSSWEICAEMGSILYEYAHDYQWAVRFLKRADSLMQNVQHDLFDERKVLTLLLHSYIELGEEEEALEVITRLTALFPDSRALSLKAGEIKSIIERSQQKPNASY